MLHTQDRTDVQVLLPREDWARLLQASDLGFDEAHQEQDDRILDTLRRALR